MSKEIARNTFSLIFNYFDVRVRGQENLEVINKESAIIAFFPHTGHLDGPFARRAIPANLREKIIFPAAADYWYKNDFFFPIRTFATSLILPTFPINRSGAGIRNVAESISKAEEYLKSGLSLVLSPEGTRTNLPFCDRELKAGIAELIIRTGKPVIPMLLDGLADIMPKGANPVQPFLLSAGKTISATIGKPIYFDLNPKMNKSSQRKEILMRLKNTYLEMQ